MKISHNQKSFGKKRFGKVKSVRVVNVNTTSCIRLWGRPAFLLWLIPFVAHMYLEPRPISQSRPCMTSYFKGGVESWRVARPGRGSGWGLGLVPQAPRSSGHTASAPGPSPDIDLWDRGITIKPAVRTTQMVAQDDSGTNTHRHTRTQIQILMHSSMHLYVLFFFFLHRYPPKSIDINK